MTAWRRIEQVLAGFGVLALAVFAAAQVHGSLSSRIALAQFQQARAERSTEASPALALPPPGEVDLSLWSPKRVTAYRQSLGTHSAAALAVLSIARIRLAVPVYDGTDELTLNRGVGRIRGTARVGEIGNLGIAGHRDGFFRGLAKVAVGDELELLTLDVAMTYTVEAIHIVSPADAALLADTDTPRLTLVTCYPFYHIGDAPKRWIVQCALKQTRRNE